KSEWKLETLTTWDSAENRLSETDRRGIVLTSRCDFEDRRLETKRADLRLGSERSTRAASSSRPTNMTSAT
ncbi:MAG: hypothetical protein AAFX50_23970, partial [Acidobacteriota bacterium]